MASGKITNKTTLSGSISSGNNLTSGTVTGGSGTTDHSRLINRAEPSQHPIEAITDLRTELDSKLDAATALPLIEEAVKGKAKGLYFDRLKELNRKSYWYLTSEIDSKTGQGTKESIISGPYDLGMGGGSGGGGGGLTTVALETVAWPTTVIVGNNLNLSVKWSSVIGEGKEPTGKGSLYLSINDKQVAIKPNQAQGVVTFEGVVLPVGENTITVKVMDTYGTTTQTVKTIIAAELIITDEGIFNDGIAWQGTVAYNYKAFGNFSKQVYFIIDGNTEKPYAIREVTSSGDLKELSITGLSHGAHTLEVYFTTVLNGETVSSNHLYHEIIVYEKNNSTPIITSAFAKESSQEQYISFNIPYYVYVDTLQRPRVYYYLEYQGVRTELSTFAGGILVDQGLQKLPYRFDNCYLDEQGKEIVGLNDYSLIIKCGVTEKKFNITVVKSSIKITPVTTALALHLDAQGRSNTEQNRASWVDKASNVSCELTGFNWASNGWLDDPVTNESFLRLNAGAKVTVPYKVLSGTPQLGGKTIELDFAARDIRDYETPILTCRNATVRKFYDVSTTFVDADIRAKNFTVTLNQDLFTSVYPNAGTYIFEYIGSDAWRLISGEAADLSACGITLTEHLEDEEGEHIDQWKLIGDLIVISVIEDAIGFYVTPQKAAIRSLQSQLSVQFKEEEHVRISIVIEDASVTSPTHILWIYVNGIASCAIQYPLQGENFAHENFMYLGADDGIATLDIYNIRVYNQALTSKQIVENWIADTQNPALRASRYAKNNIYDSWSGKITPESIEALGNLPYIIWDIDTLPQFKGDKRLGNVVYKDPLGKDRSFKSGDATYNVQGTSSAGYPVKNIRIKYKKAKAEDFPNCDFWWEKGYENEDGEEIKKFPITVGGIGDNYFTYKVDYASSEGANNVELVKLYNDLSKELSILTPPQRKNSDVRVGIDGFPIVAFHEDAAGTRTFCTKANFNNDKDNEDVYGFAAGDESWEITNNSFRTTKFKAGVNITDKSSSDYYSKAFEARFPEDNSDLSKLKAMTDWVASTDPEQATDKTLSELLGIASITFNYIDKELGENNSYKDVEKSETFTTDSREYRITKFKAELKDWFDVDSTLLYYLFTELFLMIDSRAKNAFPTYFKSRTEGDGGDKWYWIPYDMDTALGINNMGELVFDYSLEDHGEFGKYAGGKVYNGQESVMWNNVREGFYGQLSAMYARMRSSLINFAEIDGRFEEHQNKWPEAIFNEDAIIKYVNPLRSKAEGGLGENYLSMLQGSKAQQRKWWLYNRLRYIDSKYNAADAKSDYIQFRAYAGGAGSVKPSISVIPYTDIYAAVSYSNGELKTARAPRNLVTTVPTSFTTADDSNEQETYIYSASQLKDIGDLAPFYAKTVKVAPAIKLQKLKIGDDGQKYPGYKNENLRQLELGENTLLKVLDVRNCINLGKVDLNDDSVKATPTIDVSGCTNIEEIYFTGTQITGIQLPDGGTIKKLYLPGTLQALAIQNQLNIETLQIDTKIDATNKHYLEIENLWLENIPFDKISAKNLLELMLNKPTSLIGGSYSEDFGKYQRGVCLKGVKEQFATINDLLEFTSLLDNFFGVRKINKLLVADLTSKAIISGDITISGPVAYSVLAELCDWDSKEQAWRLKDYKDLLITAPKTICTVTFDAANGVDPLDYVNIKQGSVCSVPDSPNKPATQQYTYVFKHWLTPQGTVWNPEEPIIANVTLTAEYEATTRQYTVTYQTGSPVISVEPVSVIVDYGSYLLPPAISGIPEENITFEGWYTSEGQYWWFNTEETASAGYTPLAVEKDLTLIAHWRDEAMPGITNIIRKTYNTFEFTAEDTLGILGYALMLVDDLEAEPVLPGDADWFEVTPGIKITRKVSINAAGVYRLWVKDTAGNTTFAVITAHSIQINSSTGIAQLQLIEQLAESASPISNFALEGTKLIISATLDSHYENLKIHLNEEEILNKSEYEVTKSFVLNAICTPKDYTIIFRTGKEAENVKIEEQLITYLHPIGRPLALYYQGYIINNWYTDESLTELWDFESNLVEGDTILYAEWLEYRTPTRIKVKIPHNFDEWEDRPATSDANYESIRDSYNPYRVCINYSQNRANSVKVTFGDGSEEFSTEVTGQTTTIEHIYTEPGEYIIEIYGTAYGYKLGGGYSTQTVDPGCCVTDIEFAWDITTTEDFAFKGAQIEELRLTPYMTTIATGAFAVCRKLTTLQIPKSIQIIEAQAFENCEGLTGNVTIPKTVSTLGSSAFRHCHSLNQLIFEENGQLTFIESYLANDSGITYLRIPGHITKIGDGAFGNCNKLQKVVLMNPNLAMGANVFANIVTNLSVAGPIDWSLGAGNNDKYNIEYAWVERIPENAFSSPTNPLIIQSALESIILPEGVKEIGDNAFQGTFRLTSISLPNSLETIGARAFYSTGLTKLIVPNSVSNIGACAFGFNSNLADSAVTLHCSSSTTLVAYPQDGWFFGCASTLKPKIPAHLIEWQAPDENIVQNLWIQYYGPHWNVYAYNQDTGFIGTLEFEGINKETE